MAEVGGMLAAAVLKAVAGKVAAAAGERIMMQWRFGEDLEDMRDTLESIEAVLEDAERWSIEDASVRLWLKRLTRASYDISDIFDEFDVNVTRKSSSLRKFKVLNTCLALGSEVGMAGKMKKVREKLENISNHLHQFSFSVGSISYVQQVIDERATSSEVVEAEILGRDQEKQKVISLLTNLGNSSEFIILPIYGIGGIGKTTLAQLVFSDIHFKDHEKAWVYISQIFDLNKINGSIRSQVQIDQSQLTDIKGPNVDPPTRKNMLIILDDLWENSDFKLDALKHSLKTIGNRCKVHVIVTTRDASIAQKIQTTEAYQIEPLSNEICWTIIKQIVSYEDRADKERLRDAGKEIAEKCGGVALAARALGYMLRFRNFDGWVSVKDSGIWNASSSGYQTSPYDNVLASLKLSYISMLPYLRLCFAYCAIFPKGHKMAKDDLIYQWVALDFIKPSDEVSTWQHGENCIKQLLGMSFLQRSKSPSDDGQHDELFTMHDLVHDLATSIMKDEVLDASRKCNTVGSNCRYVAIADFSKPLNSFVTYPDKIRALCLLGNGGETEHAAAKLFSTAKYLRVLDLGDCSIQNLPSSIGHLKLLRYLNARGMKDRTIPSCITKLSKLIFFSLRGSSAVSALPDSIGEMESLMYLDLSGCRQMGELPESFGNLKNLLHLDLSNCSQVVLGPKSLENLTLLEYLNLSGCQRLEELPRSFKNLRNLVHLDLSNCSQVNGIPAALRSLTKLRHLNLSREWRHYRNCRAPLQGLPRAIENLKELRYLNLSSCLDCICNYEHFIEVRELECHIHGFLGIISTLSNLEHLELSHNSILKTIRVSFCGLRKLHTLDFTGCSNLHKLPDDISEMDSLNFLVVKDCTRYLRRYVQNSKKLISLPYFVVHTAEGEQSSKLCLLKDVTPPELEISCLENVKSIEEARRIKLREKQSMIKMGLHWTRGKKRFVEDVDLLRELEPPSSLEEFELQGYNSGSFPAWLDTAICLPYLVKVTLAGLSQCSSLPPLGQLPKLESLELRSMSRITKIDSGFCGSSVKAFARLERLSLSDMESLEEWTMEYSASSMGVADKFILFPNLEVLIIRECPKLRVIPWPLRVKRTWQIIDSDGVLLQRGESSRDTDRSTSAALVGCLRVESCKAPMHRWKLLRHLHSISELIITKCVDWSSSSSEIVIDGRSHLGSLKKLSMLDCSLMPSLPPWLGDLTSLQTLEIMNCQRLNNLPDSMRHLSSLESLSLNGCWGIQALPDWLGDLGTLKKLDIYFCGGIMSLPESIEQLSGLERLRILGCPALYNWCKLDENKMKIGHIKKVRVLLRYRLHCHLL